MWRQFIVLFKGFCKFWRYVKEVTIYTTNSKQIQLNLVNILKNLNSGCIFERGDYFSELTTLIFLYVIINVPLKVDHLAQLLQRGIWCAGYPRIYVLHDY